MAAAALALQPRLRALKARPSGLPTAAAAATASLLRAVPYMPSRTIHPAVARKHLIGNARMRIRAAMHITRQVHCLVPAKAMATPHGRVQSMPHRPWVCRACCNDGTCAAVSCARSSEVFWHGSTHHPRGLHGCMHPGHAISLTMRASRASSASASLSGGPEMVAALREGAAVSSGARSCCGFCNGGNGGWRTPCPD
jgi:hypothetical protein